MRRSKLFVENFLVYGFGTVISKIIPLIMLPVITRMMPNPYYIGVNDMLNVFVSLVSPMINLGMYDAMYRMFFEYSDDQRLERKQICSTALVNVFISSLFMSAILILSSGTIASLLFDDVSLKPVIVFGIIEITFACTRLIIETPTRMQNQRGRYIAVNTISAIVSYGIAFLLLANKIYLWALPVGSFLSHVLSLTIYFIFNHRWFSIKLWTAKLSKTLYKIGLPLFPTFIIFWLFSSSANIMITHMLGTEQLGIFAVGNKLAAISLLVTTAFSSGWSYFQFSTMHEKDSVRVFTKIIDYLIALGILSFSLLLPFSKVIFNIFFSEEYVTAYKVFPFLFAAPIISLIFQLMGSQFLVMKKTYYSTLIAASGVLLNIGLNYMMISRYGITGAGVAVVSGYIFISALGYYFLRKKMMIGRIPKSVFLLCIAFAQGALFLCYESIILQIVFSIVAGIYFFVFYAKELLLLARNVLSRK